MLITHARIATFGPEPQLIEDGALLIQGGAIAEVGTTTVSYTHLRAHET